MIRARVTLGAAILAAFVVLFHLPANLTAVNAVSAESPRADEARRVLKEILATPEFAAASGPSAVTRLIAQLRDLLLDLLRSIGVFGATGTRVAATVAWTAAAMAVAGLVVLLLRLQQRRRAPPAPRPATNTEPRPSAEWLARAARAMDAGDVREAIRCAHSAAVVRLAEQDVWRLDESRTPREYVRLLPHTDARRGPFTELTREFEQSWYGGRTPDGGRLWQWLEGCGCRPQHPAT